MAIAIDRIQSDLRYQDIFLRQDLLRKRKMGRGTTLTRGQRMDVGNVRGVAPVTLAAPLETSGIESSFYYNTPEGIAIEDFQKEQNPYVMPVQEPISWLNIQQQEQMDRSLLLKPSSPLSYVYTPFHEFKPAEFQPAQYNPDTGEYIPATYTASLFNDGRSFIAADPYETQPFANRQEFERDVYGGRPDFISTVFGQKQYDYQEYGGRTPFNREMYPFINPEGSFERDPFVTDRSWERTDQFEDFDTRIPYSDIKLKLPNIEDYGIQDEYTGRTAPYPRTNYDDVITETPFVRDTYVMNPEDRRERDAFTRTTYTTDNVFEQNEIIKEIFGDDVPILVNTFKSRPIYDAETYLDAVDLEGKNFDRQQFVADSSMQALAPMSSSQFAWALHIGDPDIRNEYGGGVKLGQTFWEGLFAAMSLGRSHHSSPLFGWDADDYSSQEGTEMEDFEWKLQSDHNRIKYKIPEDVIRRYKVFKPLYERYVEDTIQKNEFIKDAYDLAYAQHQTDEEQRYQTYIQEQQIEQERRDQAYDDAKAKYDAEEAERYARESAAFEARKEAVSTGNINKAVDALQNEKGEVTVTLNEEGYMPSWANAEQSGNIPSYVNTIPVEPTRFGDTSLAESLPAGTVIHMLPEGFSTKDGNIQEFLDTVRDSDTYNKGGRGGWSSEMENRLIDINTDFVIEGKDFTYVHKPTTKQDLLDNFEEIENARFQQFQLKEQENLAEHEAEQDRLYEIHEAKQDQLDADFLAADKAAFELQEDKEELEYNQKLLQDRIDFERDEDTAETVWNDENARQLEEFNIEQEEARQQFEADLAEIEQLNIKRKAEYDAGTNELLIEFEKLQVQKEIDYNAQTETLRKEHEAEQDAKKQKFDNEEAALRNTHEQAINQLEAEYNAKTAQLKADHEASEDKNEEEFNAMKAQAEADYNAETARLEAEFNAAQDEAEAKHNAEQEQAEADWNEAQAQAEIDHNKNIEEERQRYEIRKAEFEATQRTAEADFFAADRADYDRRVEEDRAEFEREQEEALQKFNNDEAIRRAEYETDKAEHEAKEKQKEADIIAETELAEKQTQSLDELVQLTSSEVNINDPKYGLTEEQKQEVIKFLRHNQLVLDTAKEIIDAAEDFLLEYKEEYEEITGVSKSELEEKLEAYEAAFELKDIMALYAQHAGLNQTFTSAGGATKIIDDQYNENVRIYEEEQKERREEYDFVTSKITEINNLLARYNTQMGTYDVRNANFALLNLEAELFDFKKDLGDTEFHKQLTEEIDNALLRVQANMQAKINYEDMINRGRKKQVVGLDGIFYRRE